MGFFDTTIKKELGKCIYCEAPMIGKVREKDGKITSLPDATTLDGKTFVCPECYKSKDLIAGDITMKDNKETLLAFLKKKHLVSPYEFTPTKRVHRMASFLSPRRDLVYMELDEGRELINIPIFDQGIMSDDLQDRIYKFEEILDFKIIDNGTLLWKAVVCLELLLEEFCLVELVLSWVHLSHHGNPLVNVHNF